GVGTDPGPPWRSENGLYQSTIGNTFCIVHGEFGDMLIKCGTTDPQDCQGGKQQSNAVGGAVRQPGQAAFKPKDQDEHKGDEDERRACPREKGCQDCQDESPPSNAPPPR